MNESRPVVGGQALFDGVMMRTDRAWAIARADGSVEVGRVRPAPFRRVPLLRVYTGLFPALLSGLRAMAGRRRRRGRNKKLLLVVAVFLVIDVGGALALGRLAPTGDSGGAQLTGGLMAVAELAIVLGILRVIAPRSIWRYHGAEHKAVSAFEAGHAPHDVAAALAATRVHPRCGTNIVFLLAFLPLLPIPGPDWLEIPAFFLAFASVVELLKAAAGRPTAAWARATSWGGRLLQRYVTTAEPDAAQQAVGCRALAAALSEHHRLAAAPVAA